MFSILNLINSNVKALHKFVQIFCLALLTLVTKSLQIFDSQNCTIWEYIAVFDIEFGSDCDSINSPSVFEPKSKNMWKNNYLTLILNFGLK